MTVLVDGKYYEDATYNTQFVSVMNGTAVPVPDEVPDPEVADNGKVLTVVEGVAAWQAPTHPAQFVIAATAPTDTTVLWVDTAGANPVLKVYITDTWVSVVDTAGA